GLDLQDIWLIIQWQYTPLLCTLLQHFGRGAWNPAVEATAVDFVESEYFDPKPGETSKNTSA
ncbi:hypothetical protein PAXRUDRAFT_179486, partial [Paxillus rubicundulus Ve08.2h10]